MISAYGAVAAEVRQTPDASPYFDLEQYKTLVQYGVYSGRMQFSFAMHQPFTAAEIQRSIRADKRTSLPAWYNKWLRVLAKDLYRLNPADSLKDDIGRAYYGVNGTLRGFAGKDKPRSEFRLEAEAMFNTDYLVLAHKTAMDRRYKTDPNYYGDTGEFIFGRVETGYAKIAYRGLNVFGGRLYRNWGIAGTPSLILSDNPYSYDHYGFQVSSRKFRFTFFATRLEDRRSVDAQSKDQSQVNAKRYFSVQRFDFSPLPNLQFGASEAAVYGGENQNFEAVYLSPMNLFYVDQRNSRVQMNGLWCFDAYWKPSNPWSVFVQYLIDDVIVNNDPGQNDRARHPDRMGITAKLINTDMIASGMQFGLSYHRIGNWSYMSYRTWENYHFHGMGMGYPKNSVEGFGVEADYFASPPFMFHAEYLSERHGDQDITVPFGDTKAKFPIGVVESSNRFLFNFRFIPSTRFHALVECDWRKVSNAGNVEGKKERVFEIMVSLFAFGYLEAWL